MALHAQAQGIMVSGLLGHAKVALAPVGSSNSPSEAFVYAFQADKLQIYCFYCCFEPAKVIHEQFTMASCNCSDLTAAL